MRAREREREKERKRGIEIKRENLNKFYKFYFVIFRFYRFLHIFALGSSFCTFFPVLGIFSFLQENLLQDHLQEFSFLGFSSTSGAVYTDSTL